MLGPICLLLVCLGRQHPVCSNVLLLLSLFLSADLVLYWVPKIPDTGSPCSGLVRSQSLLVVSDGKRKSVFLLEVEKESEPDTLEVRTCLSRPSTNGRLQDSMS